MNDESTASKKWRFKLLIYPKFQLSLIGANIALMAAAMTLVAIQIKRSMQNLKALGIDAKLPPEHAYFDFLAWQTNELFSYLTMAFIGVITLSAIVTIIISQRLAGPIVRLKGYFSRMAESGTPPGKIQFRDGDFFSDLPEIINTALKKQ